MRTLPRRRHLARRLERRLAARFVGAEIAVSAFMRDEVLRAPHARRVEVIPNGIDSARYGGDVAHAGCVIGCATRMVPGKGLDTLIESFGGLVPEARLTGLLVQPGDCAGLADALRTYARDPLLRETHGRAGGDRCERDFSIHRCATRHARLFARLSRRPLAAPVPSLEEVNV
jgi:glycosyltransferase involved in cell wall biosynthesis